MSKGVALVTGASSGIGAATARRLAAEGYQVLAAARRADRLRELASEAPGRIRPVTLDVTDPDSVAALATQVDDLDVLVNNAGGAFGGGPIETADVADWQAMYETNVIGTLRVTQELLPTLETGAGGHIVVMSSVLGHLVSEGAAGYAAAKHAIAVLRETLRLELNGRPIRITEIAPGMVKTEEFALVRYGGDTAAAAATYEGVEDPLSAEDVAEVIAWATTRPPHMNIDLIMMNPIAQAPPLKIHRAPIRAKAHPPTT